jgi:hypothetical protein
MVSNSFIKLANKIIEIFEKLAYAEEALVTGHMSGQPPRLLQPSPSFGQGPASKASPAEALA